MKTDELIAALARERRASRSERRFVACSWAHGGRASRRCRTHAAEDGALTRICRTVAAAACSGSSWGFGLAVAARRSAAWSEWRVPGSRSVRWRDAWLVPVVACGCWGWLALLLATPATAPCRVWRHLATSCPFNIVLLVAADAARSGLVALRTMAPTRPARAGAAAGSAGRRCRAGGLSSALPGTRRAVPGCLVRGRCVDSGRGGRVAGPRHAALVAAKQRATRFAQGARPPREAPLGPTAGPGVSCAAQRSLGRCAPAE